MKKIFSFHEQSILNSIMFCGVVWFNRLRAGSQMNKFIVIIIIIIKNKKQKIQLFSFDSGYSAVGRKLQWDILNTYKHKYIMGSVDSAWTNHETITNDLNEIKMIWFGVNEVKYVYRWMYT